MPPLALHQQLLQTVVGVYMDRWNAPVGAFIWGGERATDVKGISVFSQQLKCVGSSRTLIIDIFIDASAEPDEQDSWILKQLSNFHREWKELKAYTDSVVCVTGLLFIIHKFYFIAIHASLVKILFVTSIFHILQRKRLLGVKSVNLLHNCHLSCFTWVFH